MTDLLLVRHGQATHNLSERWEGWGSTPLTQEGWRQAEAVAQRLVDWHPTINQLYASPLVRARQTAEPICRKLDIAPITHEGLREIDFGQVSGMTMDEFSVALPEAYARWQNRGDMTFQFPGGEQRLSFYRRVARALDQIVEANSHGPIIVVSHGGSLRAGLAHLLPDTMQDWWGYALENASLTRVRVSAEGNQLLALNDRQHLE